MTYEDKRYWLEEIREELIMMRDIEFEFQETCKTDPVFLEAYDANERLDEELLDEYKYKIETIDEVLEDLFRLEELEL